MERSAPKKQNPVCLLGLPDDTGIRNINGRPGASLGPGAVRKHIDEIKKVMEIDDFGNIDVSSDINITHANAAISVSDLVKSGYTLIAVGGGHDLAHPVAVGIKDVIGQKKLGIINLDTHCDVRDLTHGITSGTAFSRILDSKLIDPKNFTEFGIQKGENTDADIDYVKAMGAEVIPFDEIKNNFDELFTKSLNKLAKNSDKIFCSFDLDSVRKSEAPAVSARNVNGIRAEEFKRAAYICGKCTKVAVFGLFELSPPLDIDNRTVKLAVDTVKSFLKGIKETKDIN